MNLDFINQLSKKYKIPIGLSDHTVNNNACLAATGLGASILERHFFTIPNVPFPKNKPTIKLNSF